MVPTRPDHGAHTALVVVDMQNDFAHPDGSLFVEGGDAIVAQVNAEMERAEAAGATVVLTQDWHPPSTPHFEKDGGTWPVHCVGDTWGAEFVGGLRAHADAIVRKGTNGEDGYSAFTMRDSHSGDDVPTGLVGLLRDRRVTEVVVVGLASDVCVLATAIDAASAGFRTHVLWDLTRPVATDDDTAERVVGEMRSAGVRVVAP